VCAPNTDQGHFTVHIRGEETVDRTVACGGSTGPVNVPPGTYTVTETAAPNNPHTYPNVTIGGACEGRLKVRSRWPWATRRRARSPTPE
jgi:hypothetical protein